MSSAALVACLTAAAVLAWWVPPPLTRLAATTPLVPGWVPRAAHWLRQRVSQRRRAHRQLSQELPDTLELLACCLESGAPMSRAIALLVEVSPPATARLLSRVAAALSVGRDPSDAWLSLADHPEWGLPARDAARSARSGTSLATSLRIQAQEARRRHREAENKRARAVGVASIQPLAVCFLPAFVALGVVPLVASLIAAVLDPG